MFRGVHRVALILAILLGALVACRGQEGMKQLSADGITVSYPPANEAQAKRILEIATKSIRPATDIHRQIIALLNNPSELAEEIADLLGAEEAQEAARARLLAYKQKSEALVACFSNFRLVSTADAVSTGGVDAGVLQVRYAHDIDEFSLGLELERVDADRIKRSYFPVFVNADGSIRSEKKLADTAITLLGSARSMIAAPIHETVTWIISEKLNIYHPFTRWFLEGVSGWVTTRVLTRADPKLAGLASELFSPGPTAKKLRDKVNLLAWPQTAFTNRSEAYIDPALEVAQTQYSVEAISELLGGNRDKRLAKIIGELKHGPDADTDAICAVIKKVTGVDFKKTLMNYVPQDIRDGIASGEAKRLIAQAERLAQEKKWRDAITRLRRALQMTPADVNARLNLAWLERENSERLDSEIQVFLAARLLKQQDYSLHLFATSVEGNYVLGRLAILLGDLQYAKKFLEPVLEAKPDHKDAKRAMEEIRRIESAAKGWQ
ncbi:MAG: tetratricopeptide repeat protein [Armatimonadota bacterium]